MHTKKRIDVPALVTAALFALLMDFVVAASYGIQPNDIARLGIFGLPMFLGMCALAAGVPMYMGIQFVRRWRHYKR
jgi:hypothetical protein